MCLCSRTNRAEASLSDANEGWRKYTTLVGPIATFGYWLGWSVVLFSFLGLFVGSIAQAQWWGGEPYGTNAFGGAEIDAVYFSIPPGSVHIGLQHLIAIGVILFCLGLELLRGAPRGRRPSTTWRALLLMIPLFVFMACLFLNGDFDSANLTYKLHDPDSPGGWQMALVWIWIMIWSAGGVELARRSPPSTRTP